MTGAAVRVRGPRNHFPLVASPRYLFIAGGIGITPMLPMIAEAEAAGADWRLVYGGRKRASMAFVDELAAYGDKVTLVPEDECGMLDLDAELGVPQEGTLVYACGPTGLLDAVEKRCATWPPGSLHLERFAAKAARADRQHRIRAGAAALGADAVACPRTSRSSRCASRPASACVGSCLEGICGTCETEVVDGDVDHRDSVLNEEEREANEYMMICVSRCRSARLDAGPVTGTPERRPMMKAVTKPDPKLGVTATGYPRNAWYALAASEEVTDEPFGTRALDRPVVLYRDHRRIGGSAGRPRCAPALPVEPGPGGGRHHRVRLFRLRLRQATAPACGCRRRPRCRTAPRSQLSGV